MSRVRVYLKTYDSNGTLQSSFTEITDYVDLNSLGTITQTLDNTEYNIGVIRNSNITLKLTNREGLFSTPDISESLFRFKRDDSIIKITYDFTTYDLVPGFFYLGQDIMSEEYTIFEGMLNDDATTDNAKDQMVQFQVLGYENLLSKIQVPFSSISNGDLISSIIYDCLNQSEFTDFITLDALNIDLGTDLVYDNVSDFENKNVFDALKDLLLISNSVLYITLDKVVKVRAREESADVEFTFYGQASDNGVENIAELKDIRTGVNKVFNYWNWEDTSLVAQNASSLSTYGTRNKQIGVDGITNDTNRQTILNNLLSEFAIPKKEITVKAIISDEDLLSLFLLDKVSVDYPQIQIAALGDTLPLYDVALYDADSVYPNGLYNISIEAADSWKVMERKVDLKTETIEFKLRAV